MTMTIDILAATEQDRLILSHLIEFYVYDFSEFMGWNVGGDGRFGGGDKTLAGCWSEPWRHPFLITVDGAWAGFAIVDERDHLPGDGQTRVMKEFLVMRTYRGRGVGAAVATRLFDRFPGTWEVRELAKNVTARAFWREVIGRYTGGRFEEVVWDDRPVQLFDTIDRADMTRHPDTERID